MMGTDPDMTGTDAEKIAIIVDPDLPVGLLANTVAVIAIGIGAVKPGFGGTKLTDSGGRSILNSANRPVPILQAPPSHMSELLRAALPAPEHSVVVAFPQFARSLHEFENYRRQFRTKSLGAERIEGLGLAGPERWVRSLTSSIKLLR